MKCKHCGKEIKKGNGRYNSPEGTFCTKECITLYLIEEQPKKKDKQLIDVREDVFINSSDRRPQRNV